MLTDLPKLSPLTKIYLFADDVTITASCKQPSDAEVTIQPALDKVHRWSSKWKLKLAPDKSACVVFSRSYKPGPDPLLFINGHPIPPKSKFKFLGIWFDQKLLWKPHIEHVHAHCIKLKNLFSMITNSKCGPSTKTLILLFKTLVRSKTDYGLIAYGNASKSNLNKIDTACRSILRVIRGSKLSTPTEILYAESSTEPLATRRSWLSGKYLVKLGHKPNNPAYTQAKAASLHPTAYPPRSTPCLSDTISFLKESNLAAFPEVPVTSRHKHPPPSSPPICKTAWFPLTKTEALKNKTRTAELFESLLVTKRGEIVAYTDGSRSEELNSTTCAAFIPSLNVRLAWTLHNLSSIFSAELQGIKQALQLVYNLDYSPSGVSIFTDSSSSIQAISSAAPSDNVAIWDIRELIKSLESSGTRTTLVWIPSHAGITGNDAADRLAGDQCSTRSAPTLATHLSPDEKIAAIKKAWTQDHLRALKK